MIPKITRREAVALAAAPLASAESIDRRTLTRRHNPVNRSLDPFSPLSVGNGEFCFTADLTGLQTFPAAYEKAIPLCTMSQWGWHSHPNRPSGELRLTAYSTNGREVAYPTAPGNQKTLFDWLRENPHRLHLGRIGLVTDAQPHELTAAEQTLDLYSGILTSRFRLRDQAYTVRTACHPSHDSLAISIEGPSPGIVIEFPYGSPDITGADWRSPRAHKSNLAANSSSILRELDDTRYQVEVVSAQVAPLRQDAPHRFIVHSTGNALNLSVHFSATTHSGAPDSAEIFAASEKHWAQFWTRGGAIDLSASTDQRAPELERRIILSQYLTAIQCSGSTPPQETGLTCNSWYGKFHLEMHWWHAAHFPLWGRSEMLSRSLDWYRKIVPQAAETARRQGYAGVRWPKMVGPEGRDSPSPIGPLLIWQQPHFIYLAELAGRYDLADLVFKTAGFMASYAIERDGMFHLGPPVIPAQENHPPRETWDPAFELEYWRWGLATAQRWRQRAGLPPEPLWDRVRQNLAPLAVKDGVYLAHANCPQTYTERNRDHPSMLMALGFLPGETVDKETMRSTLKKVMRDWRWPDTWGWDYPMVAMTATRLGEPRIALDALLLDTPKNRYLPNGHNYQRPGLHCYLPGNGGLLAATAMMAVRAQGFPPGFRVRHQGLRRLP